MEKNKRILIIDDSEAIHRDFQEILSPRESHKKNLDVMEAEIFGNGDEPRAPESPLLGFELESAFQGRDGVDLVRESLEADTPFAMAFVDVRMPPGLDGLKTIKLLWELDPGIEIVLCTAYSDYSWEEISLQTGETDKLVILKKPFENMEVRQLAAAMTEKWNALRQVRIKVKELEKENTERKIAEKELQKTKSYLNNVINSMPSVLIGLDNSLNITHWNQGAEQMAGIEFEEADGQALVEVFPRFKMHLEKIHSVLENGEEFKAEKIQAQEEGETHFYDIIIFPLEKNGVEGLVLQIDEVTARVRLEEIMIQTEKMMSVGGLAAGMAHEINNPLSGILQGTQNTLRRFSGELKKNLDVAQECGVDLVAMQKYMDKRGILMFLKSIQESGERASRIVDNMLQFSRGSESKVAPANFTELINRTIELASSDYDLKKQYDFRHIEIIKDFSEGLEEVPCVITEIEQVMLNLLRNAAQAMKGQENPRIFLKTQRIKDTAIIEIGDNGPGMTENVRKRIFEPFFTTKEVGVGTGLGLSVSYFIITNNHKGSMSVESAPGKGAKFIIRLSLDWRRA